MELGAARFRDVDSVFVSSFLSFLRQIFMAKRRPASGGNFFRARTTVENAPRPTVRSSSKRSLADGDSELTDVDVGSTPPADDRLPRLRCDRLPNESLDSDRRGGVPGAGELGSLDSPPDESPAARPERRRLK